MKTLNLIYVVHTEAKCVYGRWKNVNSVKTVVNLKISSHTQKDKGSRWKEIRERNQVLSSFWNWNAYIGIHWAKEEHQALKPTFLVAKPTV